MAFRRRSFRRSFRRGYRTSRFSRRRTGMRVRRLRIGYRM